MGSEAAVESAAWAARRSWALASAYRAAEIIGCANRMPGVSRSVASSPRDAACAVSASAFSRPAACSSVSVGRAPALATSRVRRASAESISRRLRTSARNEVGTGRGFAGAGPGGILGERAAEFQREERVAAAGAVDVADGRAGQPGVAAVAEEFGDLRAGERVEPHGQGVRRGRA
jgi:hypothetical protein